MSKKRETEFGIAMRNFTKYPEMPSAAELIEYGVHGGAGLQVGVGLGSLFCWASNPIFQFMRR